MITNLKNLRIRRGLTQVRLAELTGISRINIVRYENQEINPGLDACVRIADILGCTVDDLLRPEPQERIETPEQTVLAGAETPEGSTQYNL